MDLRHDATPGSLPPLPLLRASLPSVLAWLQEFYWERQVCMYIRMCDSLHASSDMPRFAGSSFPLFTSLSSPPSLHLPLSLTSYLFRLSLWPHSTRVWRPYCSNTWRLLKVHRKLLSHLSSKASVPPSAQMPSSMHLIYMLCICFSCVLLCTCFIFFPPWLFFCHQHVLVVGCPVSNLRNPFLLRFFMPCLFFFLFSYLY